MKYDLRRPCKDCPFLEGVSFLTRARARQIARSITDHQQSFPCHKTLDYSGSEDDEGMADPVETKHTQHCAGAMILLELIEQPNQMMRIAERIGLYDRTKLDMSAPVYQTPDAFIAGHGK